MVSPSRLIAVHCQRPISTRARCEDGPNLAARWNSWLVFDQKPGAACLRSVAENMIVLGGNFDNELIEASGVHSSLVYHP